MELKELFNGIAVVIDDKVNDDSDHITTILEQLDNSSIPVLKYDSIPNSNTIIMFYGISFVLLDWRLSDNPFTDEDKIEGVTLPSTVDEYNAKDNIEFIKNLMNVCYCPIFIFTNESTEYIEKLLSKELTISSLHNSNIFVKSKLDITNEKDIMTTITEWLQDTPSVYVLKQWDANISACKTRLFNEYQNYNTNWPVVLWKAFKEDGIVASKALNDTLMTNLLSRVPSYSFDSLILDKSLEDIKQHEIRMILEGERYLRNSNLYESDIGTGDIFKKCVTDEDTDCTDYIYYLNIRPQCDLTREENPKLYLIKGKSCEINNKGNINNIAKYHKGKYLEKVNHGIIAFIDGGQVVEFSFVELEVISWLDIRDYRIGRLLPPYINQFQQRYGLYMQRVGLSRIPDQAVKQPG